MASPIPKLAEHLKSLLGTTMQIQYNERQMLVKMFFNNKRQQAVKIDWSTQSPNRIALSSRACAVSDYRLLQTAMISNSGLDLGGLALSEVNGANSLDVIYQIPVQGLSTLLLYNSIYRLALQADSIEQKFGTQDRF